MKLKSWTAGIAALTLAAAPAFADDSLAKWTNDQMVTPAGCCDSDYDCGDGCGCGSACGGGGLLSGMGPGYLEGFSLANLTGLRGLEVGGWTQFGYHDESTLMSTSGGSSFNNRPEELNLHQQNFYIGKQADGSRGLDIGFRADFMYGIDAQDTQAFGNPVNSFDNGGSFNHGSYGWAIPQLYVEVASGDWSLMVGRFYTIAGYESVAAPQNFFYSHSLTSYNSEPFTHTGALATYTGYENMTLYAGWTLGWDTGFDNFNSGNSYLGGFSVGLNDNVTMTYISSYGNFGRRGGVGQDGSYAHSLVFDVAVSDRVNYVFQTDMVETDSVAGTVGNDQVGVNQYLFYKYNDIVTLGTRMEWWKSDGVSYCGCTSGANIQLLDNLVFRPECRIDWVPGLNYEETILGGDLILTY